MQLFYYLYMLQVLKGEVMKVALYQFNPSFGKIEENVSTVIEAVEKEDFDLLVLPEFFATGYQFKSVDEAHSLADRAGKGLTFDKMSELARKKKALIVYGFPELGENGRLYNSAMAVTPDGNNHLYRKIHLFDTEKAFFEPGDTGFVVFGYNGARIGLMICFDWRFPEAARKLTLMGAQVICHPSNLVMPHCPDAMITRALENNVFTITANRIGIENRTDAALVFIGRSRIIGPDGQVLAELGAEETAIASCEIDPALADQKSITPRNNLLEDRRPEFY